MIETLFQLVTQPVVPPHKRTPAVDVGLSVICLKCLEKDPQKRYASAEGLADDLERWLAGEFYGARAPSSARRSGGWWRSLAGLFPFRKRPQR